MPVLSGLTLAGATCYDYPAISGVDGTGQAAFLTAGPAGIGHVGWALGWNDPSFAYLSDYGITALEVYQAIADAVNSIRGMGVRWLLLADPLLV